LGSGKNTLLTVKSYYALNAKQGVKHFRRREFMNNISKALMKPLAIPLIHQKTVDKRLVMIAAGIVALLSLNAMAADSSSSTDAPPAAGPGANGEHKLTIQERIERMKSMTPEQRTQERKLIRKEMQSLSPEQRAEQRKAMRAQFEKMSPEDRRIMREQFREYIKNLSPEERRKHQEEMRKERDNMTPEQRMERRKEMREHWERMSPEEREQMRKRMKEHWKSMPPEQREERRKEMREHFKNMSPEERQQFKRDMGKGDGMPPPVDDRQSDKPDAKPAR
jgi:Spy/CpxP family protein refolding chaperone